MHVATNKPAELTPACTTSFVSLDHMQPCTHEFPIYAHYYYQKKKKKKIERASCGREGGTRSFAHS